MLLLLLGLLLRLLLLLLLLVLLHDTMHAPEPLLRLVQCVHVLVHAVVCVRTKGRGWLQVMFV